MNSTAARTSSSQATWRSAASTATAIRARLVLVTAATAPVARAWPAAARSRPPSWSEIAEMTSDPLSRSVTSTAAKVAASPTVPTGVRPASSQEKTSAATQASSPNRARLNTSFRPRWREWTTSTGSDPARPARTMPAGSIRCRPRTSGTSIRVTEWTSRRNCRWTRSTTLAPNSTASIGQGRWKAPFGWARPPTGPSSSAAVAAPAARPSRRVGGTRLIPTTSPCSGPL